MECQSKNGENLKMEGKIDLETLQHILEQYSNDVLGDCPRIICNMLNSLNESLSSDDFRIFTSVKVILNLYENMCTDICNTKLKLPVTLIIDAIKKVLNCQNNIQIDQKIQLELLSIIQSLFKISLLENTSNALDEFAEFYNFIITSLSTAHVAEESERDCVIFKLKILDKLYGFPVNETCEIKKAEMLKKLKSENVNECELFADLVLRNGGSIAIQTLMFLIPGYIACFKSTTILEVMWKKISNSMPDSTTNLSRGMLILCSFFDNYKKKEEIHMMKCLIEDANYWELLQSVIVNSDPTVRKQGMYLLRKTVDMLENTNETIKCSKESISFYWDRNSKTELHKFYCDIITILEFLDEQQAHIIRPIFKMAETLFEKIEKCNKVSFSWVFLIYRRALSHESTEIIKLGLNHLFNLPISFFQQEYSAKEAVSLIMPVLNSIAIYYNSGTNVSKSLEMFLKKMTKLSNAKMFFCCFIQKLCSLVWSPEALFFVVIAMSFDYELNKYSFWGEEEIYLIKSFVMKSFNTFHRTIRIAIECKLLSAITMFTDVKNVSLKNIINLISNFPLMDSLYIQSQAFSNIINWLERSHSKQEFQQIIDSYKKQKLEEEFSDKFISLIYVISYKRLHTFKISHDKPIPTEEKNPLLGILIQFKDIDRRLYCNKKIFDHYLSVISYYYKLCAINSMVLQELHFLLKDVLLFIRNQLKQISSLQEFHSCQLYLNAFSNITRVQNLFDICYEYIISLYENVLRDLEVCIQQETNVSPIEFYSLIKLLNSFIEMRPPENQLNFLAPYLLTDVNKPLKKEISYSEQTKDVETLRGRMNSEFIEAKWKIFEYLIKNKLVIHGNDQLKSHNSITDDDLVNLCSEGLNTGGYQVLFPIMSILKDILPHLNSFSQIREIVNSVWKLLMEKKKSDEFKSFVKGFVEMVFQEKFISRGEIVEEILIEYADLIFSDPSLAVVNIFMRQIQKIDLAGSSVPLFCHIIGKALIYGPVQRKDEKLTNEVCFHINDLQICPIFDLQAKDEIGINKKLNSYLWPEKSGEHYTSNEVRGRGIERVLTLKKDSPRDQTVGKSLMETLMKLESEIGKKRYFGDSHIHLVKNRVMQSLLLLDHILRLEETETTKLFNWLWESLMTETLQPSIRHQQEWLMSRLLINNRDLYDRFYSSMKRDKNKTKRGLCSYASIFLHVSKRLPAAFETEFHNSKCLSLLFHQRFEVRLYAQVVFMLLYKFAEGKNLRNFLNEWRNLYEQLVHSYEEFLEGQLSRNMSSLFKSIFLTFDPLEDYSLETIYSELPRATNVHSNEGISNKLLRYCGIDTSKIEIALEATPTSQLTFKATKGCDNDAIGDLELNEIFENHQKKFIPTKPFLLETNEDCSISCEGRDGLIVVASLIDRIPNLGGLARTCEIFGVSEYVLGSHKYAEDKQFTSLSVTAEKWIRVKEVKPQNLVKYILEQKENGYVVVGAEQTIHSQPLSSVKFPKKSLLLLGNEKEGISPNLLPLLDICVEIPQMGVIRSLNVHVTGALFIWEYAKQIYFS